jgi:hypothetical protein
VYWHEDDFLNADWATHGNQQRFNELSRVRTWCQQGDWGGLKDYFSDGAIKTVQQLQGSTDSGLIRE